MIEWVLGALSVVFIGYITYIINTTSGSQYGDNTIDAFIVSDDTSDEASKTSKQQVPQRNKYSINYTSEGRQLLILYGTEYGFSEEVARAVFDRISALGDLGPDDISPLQPRLVNAKYYDSILWGEEKVCIIIISTSGDGVPPTDARPFYDYLMTSSGHMTHINYCVLALGDSNYPQFCKTGKIVNQRLYELSAKQMLDCQLVDMEDWNIINSWMKKLISILPSIDTEVKMDYLDLEGLGQGEGHTRNNPFLATLKVKKMLTLVENKSDKETIHCEFDISESGLSWTSGDAVGIYPQNNPVYVDAILCSLGYHGDEMVDVPSWAYSKVTDTIDIKTALIKFYDIKHVKQELLTELNRVCQERNKNSEHCQHLCRFLESSKETAKFISSREVTDVLEVFGDLDLLSPQRFLSCLKPLQPRYYSISSSPKVDPNTVCVTAAVVRYHLEEIQKLKEGVTTAHLQDRMVAMDTCHVFISKNPDFRLPSNHQVPVILIGPGTGLAPFRAFIQEREMAINAGDAVGQTILYSGCRHKDKDFLYRDELANWHKRGIIQLSTAFSRDQDWKIYVQDLLLEDQSNLWNLIHLTNGSIYVCGDAKHMAHDVHRTLLQIAQLQGQMDPTQAQEYFEELEKRCRYQKDVWVT